MIRRLGVGALLAAIVAAPAAAQEDVGDLVAYVALILTPVGGLGPPVYAPMLSAAPARLTVSPRFGRVTPYGDEDDDRFNQFGLTLGLPAGPRGTFALTLGAINNPGCGSCDTELTGGVSGYARLVTPRQASTPLIVGVSGELGMFKPDESTFIAGAVGLPVSIVAEGTSVRFVPYVTPSVGFGRASGAGDSESGRRLMLAGGVVLMSVKSMLGVNVGIQKTFIEDGGAVFGIGLVFGSGSAVTESARKQSGM